MQCVGRNGVAESKTNDPPGKNERFEGGRTPMSVEVPGRAKLSRLTLQPFYRRVCPSTCSPENIQLPFYRLHR
jgi:hypothetical protein